ncbi:391_t:CDS:2, partial [Funneliformis caledonium]
KKYEKQVDLTGDEETSDEEDFQSIDELDDDEPDLEDYDLPLNDDKLFSCFEKY